MTHYYVNNRTQANGDHQIHRTGCSFMPETDSRCYLGEFDSFARALVEAHRRYKQVGVCRYCCPVGAEMDDDAKMEGT